MKGFFEIYVVTLKKTGEVKYFSSIASIFRNTYSSELGITKQSLYDYRLSSKEYYENKLCTIRKAKVL